MAKPTRKDSSVAKMAEKILKFKNDDKSKYERANRRCDDGDYVGALSSLLYTAKSEPKNTDVLCHIADIYTELGLYENAVIFWFKFLSVCKKSELIDGYNGLGANFYFLENLELAGFYFNKQLELGNVGDCVYDDILDDYIDDVSNIEKPPFEVISAESEMREKDEQNYLKAVEKNKEDDYISAIEFADKIGSASDFYQKALFEKGYALFCLDRDYESEEILKRAVELDKNDVGAYNLLFNCFAQTGDNDKAEEYFEKFISADTDDTDILNRKMSLLCDFGYFDEALKVSDKILRISPEDTNCSYLRGLISYNVNDLDGAVFCLKKAYLYSLNPVALYYMRIAEKARDGEKNVPKRLPLIFELQKAETDRRLEAVKKLFAGTAKKGEYSDKYISEVATWCFFVGNQTAQMAMAVYSVRSKKKELIDLIKNQLVNPAISDDIKSRIFALFVEFGEAANHSEIAVVYSNIFKKIKVSVPEFGVDVPRSFRQAYAYAAGKISIFYDKDMKKLASAAAELEAVMRINDVFGDYNDIRVIACAIFISSGILRDSGIDSVCRFFDAKKEDVLKLIALVKDKKDD